MLGTRLSRRGIAISAVVMGVMLTHLVSEGAIGPIIGGATAAGGNGLVAGPGVGAMIASAKVVQIIRSAARAVVYAKLRYAMVAVLVISSAAIATGSNVVEQIKAHLPSLNLSGWIKPLLRAIAPDLQASADSQDPLAPLAADAQPELKIHYSDSSFGQNPQFMRRFAGGIGAVEPRSRDGCGKSPRRINHPRSWPIPLQRPMSLTPRPRQF